MMEYQERKIICFDSAGNIYSGGKILTSDLHIMCLLEYLRGKYPTHTIYQKLTYTSDLNTILYLLTQEKEACLLNVSRSDYLDLDLVLPDLLSEAQERNIAKVLSTFPNYRFSINYHLCYEDGLISDETFVGEKEESPLSIWEHFLESRKLKR